MFGEVYQLVNLHGLEIGAYLKSQYQCGCYLSAVCIDRSPLLVVGFSRSLLECIESCTYVTGELSLTRYTYCVIVLDGCIIEPDQELFIDYDWQKTRLHTQNLQ